jgi:hypothetical protein
MLSTRTTPPVMASITGTEQTGFRHKCGDRSPTSISNAHRTAREMQFVTETRSGNGDPLFLDPYQRAHTIELDSYRDKSRPTHGHAREHDRPTDDSTPPDMSNMTCYGCGEKGHIAKDPKCKNFGKSKPSMKMFMA